MTHSVTTVLSAHSALTCVEHKDIWFIVISVKGQFSMRDKVKR